MWHGVVGSDNGIFKPGSAAAPFYLTAQPNRYEDAESEDDERLSCVVTVVGFILLIRNDPDIPSVDPAKTTVDGSAKFPQTNPPRPIVQRILIEESSVMSSSLMRRYARNELKKTDPTPEVILANLSIPTDEIIKEYVVFPFKRTRKKEPLSNLRQVLQAQVRLRGFQGFPGQRHSRVQEVARAEEGQVTRRVICS